MKKIIFTLLCGAVALGAYAQERTVKGKVTDGKAPMENVNIQILDKTVSTTTDTEGKYEIAVETGDRIQYTYTGMKTITIRVEDVTRFLNPVMIPDIEELDEVIVEASKRRSQQDMAQDYPIKKTIIRTAYGYIDADRAPGRIRMLSEEDINPISLCVLDLLRNRFAGVVIYGDCMRGGDAYLARAMGSVFSPSPMVWDIDGQIFSFNGPGVPSAPIWLDVNNIKRLAILGNLSTAVQYGNLGAGGVVVINTVSGSARRGPIVDYARLRNNYVNGKVLDPADLLANAPVYQKELAQSSSFSVARATFEKYEKTFSNSPYFYLDAYRYFVDKWNETEFADTIIEENYGLFIENPVLLKALAYSYEEQNRFNKANHALKEVFIHRPNYAQSYLDMANSYRDLDEPRQAAALYARYDYLLEEGFMERDTMDFGPIMNREFNNLLLLERNAVVDGRKGKKLYIADEEFKGTRLVFEWNDGEAEFELQFVNPENQYFKWKHSLADNEERVQREKDFGYNVMEELIDESLPGQWKVNVNYLGNKSLTPTYLKATVYHNYGSKSQRKETKVFKLNLKNVNQELFKLNISGRLATQK